MISICLIVRDCFVRITTQAVTGLGCQAVWIRSESQVDYLCCRFVVDGVIISLSILYRSSEYDVGVVAMVVVIEFDIRQCIERFGERNNSLFLSQ